MKKINDLSNKDLLNTYEDQSEYDLDTCKEICKRANMLQAWKDADGESFESVVEEAIEKLERE